MHSHVTRGDVTPLTCNFKITAVFKLTKKPSKFEQILLLNLDRNVLSILSESAK